MKEQLIKLLATPILKLERALDQKSLLAVKIEKVLDRPRLNQGRPMRKGGEK